MAAGRRVLVVEDDADTAESLRTLLALWGHTVTVARNAGEALASASSVRPEVVILDIGLPGVDGLALARQMRASRGHRPSIIAVTGYGRPDDRRRALEAGCDRFFLKPPDIEELRTAVASAAPARRRGKTGPPGVR